MARVFTSGRGGCRLHCAVQHAGSLAHSPPSGGKGQPWWAIRLSRATRQGWSAASP